MNTPQFTEQSEQAILGAQQEAQRQGHPQVEALHLLRGLLAERDGLASEILRAAKVNPDELRRRVDQAVNALPRVSGNAQIKPSPAFRDAVLRAQRLASSMGDDFTSIEHLLLALADFENTDRSGDLLRGSGAEPERLRQATETVRGGQRASSANPEGTYQALKRYGRDLTDLARDGKLDPVIGRDDEIRRAIQVLQRRTKNNPVLIGEPGVGKT
ncbi:MAG: Clp protease N-terminal domain-containing protein, partial [Chloroflexota bacterium]